MFSVGLKKEDREILEGIHKSLMAVYDLIKSLDNNREIVIKIQLNTKSR